MSIFKVAINKRFTDDVKFNHALDAFARKKRDVENSKLSLTIRKISNRKILFHISHENEGCKGLYSRVEKTQWQ